MTYQKGPVPNNSMPFDAEARHGRSPNLAVRASRAFAPKGLNLSDAPGTPKNIASFGYHANGGRAAN